MPIKYLLHWGSHIPLLVKLLEASPKGDVLEIGMGIYSSPVLHWLCAFQDRKLVSIENNAGYYEMFRKEKTPGHKRFLINDLLSVDLNRPWDIVFIDSGSNVADRSKLALKVANNTRFIVLHDTEPGADSYYHYSEIYPLFKYFYNYDRFVPNTGVLSNSEPLDFLKDVMEKV